MLMVSENYRSDKTVANRVCSITDSKREEHRITGHILGADSYWIPSSFIKYYTDSIDLFKQNNYIFPLIPIIFFIVFMNTRLERYYVTRIKAQFFIS